MQVKDCVLIEAFKCNENENVVEVAKKLSEVTLRHIFVADDNEYPVGIISVLDINNRVVAENKNLAETTAKDVMSAPIRVAKMEEDAKTLADESTPGIPAPGCVPAPTKYKFLYISD